MPPRATKILRVQLDITEMAIRDHALQWGRHHHYKRRTLVVGATTSWQRIFPPDFKAKLKELSPEEYLKWKAKGVHRCLLYDVEIGNGGVKKFQKITAKGVFHRCDGIRPVIEMAAPFLAPGSEVGGIRIITRLFVIAVNHHRDPEALEVIREIFKPHCETINILKEKLAKVEDRQKIEFEARFKSTYERIEGVMSPALGAAGAGAVIPTLRILKDVGGLIQDYVAWHEKAAILSDHFIETTVSYEQEPVDAEDNDEGGSEAPNAPLAMKVALQSSAPPTQRKIVPRDDGKEYDVHCTFTWESGARKAPEIEGIVEFKLTDVQPSA